MEHFAQIDKWQLSLGFTRKIIAGKLPEQTDFGSPNVARHGLVAY
jgi:hypothetical protein